MKGLISRVLLSGLIIGSAISLVSCGSGGSDNNDQGVSFTLNGFFTDSTAETGLLGYTVPFGTNLSAAAQLQNNLVGQGIRVRRLLLSYNIPGASISIPSTSIGITSVLGPVECADDKSPYCVQTTLPPAFTTKNISTNSFPSVPAVVNDFLVLNRDSLPALPFQMEITVVAEGVTTAGDLLYSNEGILTVEYLDDSGVGGSTSSEASSTAG